MSRKLLSVTVLVGAAILATAARGDDDSSSITTWTWFEIPENGMKFNIAIIKTRTDPAAESGKTVITNIALACGGGIGMLGWGFSEDVADKKGLDIRYQFSGHDEHKVIAVPEDRKETRRRNFRTFDQKEIQRFVSEAVNSETVRLQVSSKALGKTSATFQAKGGKEFADKFTGLCPKVMAGKLNH